MDHKFSFESLVSRGYNFFTGVPDSGLKIFQDKIINSGFPHVPAIHESQAVGIAFGAALSGFNPCIYMQNSGLGNIINPLTSLCIPCEIYPLIVIGHRHTLPQHKIMGEVDRDILNLIGYDNYIIVRGDNNER